MNLISTDDGQHFDLSDIYDCYRYVVYKLGKNGESSNVLSALGKIYRDTKTYEMEHFK